MGKEKRRKIKSYQVLGALTAYNQAGMISMVLCPFHQPMCV